MKHINSIIFLLIFSVSSTVFANAYQLKLLYSGLGVPWSMVFISNNEILFTERNGKVGIFNIQLKSVNYITGSPTVMADGQGGLLDVAIAPNYQSGDWIYFTYSKPVQDQGATTLARAHLDKKELKDWKDLLVTHSRTDTNIHYGSRIAFDDQSHVYFSIGDRGFRPNAQNLKTHAGSILRLNLDGTIPKDNPFIEHSVALPEIWSYGHRNPQGLVWDNENKRLWSIEHGPRGGDEINLIEKGKNYGWPIISYGKEYWGPVSVGEGTHKKGMEQPVKVYVPSIAPGSLLYYSGNAFKNWQGDLFSGALKLRHLNRITLDATGMAISEQRLFENLNERIRALVQSQEGWIYFSTDSGKIYVIKPK
ncbi:MAG: PQQ-dependent sugar dehydrogenase [Candidatus Thioglobus sp.]|nr:PQQ-dependent sugar dehydrogenase [Candidatus Thioglobus pontius]MBL6985127.1 PQQ-dependent sugar dehydrogenase [Candidatus Thioglobus sp.]